MEVSAQLNYLRIAPRKVRIVIRAIKGLDVYTAKARLRYITKRASIPLEKLLNSAVANAQHRHNVGEDTLFIKDIVVDEGSKLKRYKPKGFGMAMPIQKKTSRIKVVLGELEGEAKQRLAQRMAASRTFTSHIEAPKAAPRAQEEIRTEQQEKEKMKTTKPTVVHELTKGAKKGIFSGVRNIGRKMFRRKSV